MRVRLCNIFFVHRVRRRSLEKVKDLTAGGRGHSVSLSAVHTRSPAVPVAPPDAATLALDSECRSQASLVYFEPTAELRRWRVARGGGRRRSAPAVGQRLAPTIIV